MAPPILVLTVGNESRGDDALGPLLSRRLAEWLSSTEMADEVELIEEFQLQVENTLDLKDRRLVLFMDAGHGTQPPFVFYQAVKMGLEGHTSHAIAPETLLGVYAMAHDEEPPPMFVLCVAGSVFELGEPLSQQAALNLDQAFDFACKLLQRPERNVWQSHALGLLPLAADFNFISKVKQGDDERTTKTVQVARRGVNEEANTVSPMKWN